jgi:hypothetical protein
MHVEGVYTSRIIPIMNRNRLHNHNFSNYMPHVMSNDDALHEKARTSNNPFREPSNSHYCLFGLTALRHRSDLFDRLAE